MKATINQGTENEISWSLDDPVTPELVFAIKKAGDSMNLNWFDSPFLEVIDLLLTKYDNDQLEEMLYDEDPEIIDLSCITLQNPMNKNQNIETIVRLYLPVMIILLGKRKCEN